MGMIASSCPSDIQVQMSSGRLDNISVDFSSDIWTRDTNLENTVIWWYLKPWAQLDPWGYVDMAEPEAWWHQVKEEDKNQLTKLSLRRTEQWGNPSKCCKGQMKTFYQRRKEGQIVSNLIKDLRSLLLDLQCRGPLVTSRRAVSMEWQEWSLNRKDLRENREELKLEYKLHLNFCYNEEQRNRGWSGWWGQGSLFYFPFRVRYIRLVQT